jgi:hypothetical protein
MPDGKERIVDKQYVTTIDTVKKKKTKENTIAKSRVRVRGFNAGLLAGSQLHSEGPATGQLDQGFPWSQSKC